VPADWVWLVLQSLLKQERNERKGRFKQTQQRGCNDNLQMSPCQVNPRTGKYREGH